MSQHICYNIQREFKLAQDKLKYCLGLELCLAEQVILRRTIVQAIKELHEIKENRNRFNPANEGVIRFLFQEYGIHSGDEEFCRPIVEQYEDLRASFTLNFIQSQRYQLERANRKRKK